jgi:hypothetical protein
MHACIRERAPFVSSCLFKEVMAQVRRKEVASGSSFLRLAARGPWRRIVVDAAKRTKEVMWGK